MHLWRVPAVWGPFGWTGPHPEKHLLSFLRRCSVALQRTNMTGLHRHSIVKPLAFSVLTSVGGVSSSGIPSSTMRNAMKPTKEAYAGAIGRHCGRSWL